MNLHLPFIYLQQFPAHDLLHFGMSTCSLSCLILLSKFPKSYYFSHIFQCVCLIENELFQKNNYNIIVL